VVLAVLKAESSPSESEHGLAIARKSPTIHDNERNTERFINARDDKPIGEGYSDKKSFTSSIAISDSIVLAEFFCQSFSSARSRIR